MQLKRNFSDYDEVDFAGDEFFQEWVLRPTTHSVEFWKDFLAQHPEKKEITDKAIAIIRSVQFKEEWPEKDVVENSLNKALQQINILSDKQLKVISFRLRHWWAAAAILLLIATGTYLLITQSAPQGTFQTAEEISHHDFLPGGNKAILTLSDGTKIVLDSVQNGFLSKQGNAKIIKIESGKVAYRKESEVSSGKIEYNTVATPRGGQYQLELADGSKVWLNTTSSITFPSIFAGNDRQVKITGEVYFEVAHDPAKPFRVSVNGIQIEVLGTHFDVNAYGDDNDIKTSLLEGSVKVEKGGQSVLLKPGEQVLVKNGDHHLSVKKGVDMDEVIAWKNGFFSFRHSCIEDITKQLSRWYDIEVAYADEIRNQEFTGKIDRTLKLSQVLKILEKTGVRYKIEEGRKITILP